MNPREAKCYVSMDYVVFSVKAVQGKGQALEQECHVWLWHSSHRIAELNNGHARVKREMLQASMC